MRAYMSEEYARLSFLCAFDEPKPYACRENDAALMAGASEAAEREARAILADVEPETPDASHVPASSLRWYDVTPRDASYRLMLAEALAAFVEEGN